MTFEKSKELIVGVDVGNGTICTARKQFRASIKAMESVNYNEQNDSDMKADFTFIDVSG